MRQSRNFTTLVNRGDRQGEGRERDTKTKDNPQHTMQLAGSCIGGCYNTHTDTHWLGLLVVDLPFRGVKKSSEGS